MKNSPDQLESVLEELTARIDQMERRLAALEQSRAFSFQIQPAPAKSPASHPLEQLSLAQPSGLMALTGKVFLGIAGAYLLRAVAESGMIPYIAIVPLALLYGLIWLFAASRVPDGARLATAAYSLSAALIVAPMLGELNLRFHALSSNMTAALLLGFAVLAFSLAWKRALAPLAVIAGSASVATALVLLVAARDPAPFTLALLLIAAAMEYCGWHERWLKMRPLTAAAADFAVLALVLVYSNREGLPPEYRPLSQAILLALAAGLLLVYGISTVRRNVVLRKKITTFEISQTVIAFLLSEFGLLRLSNGAAATPLGVIFLIAAAGCYLAAFRLFSDGVQPRNYHVFAAWAAALLLTGSILALPASVLPIALSLAAAVIIATGTRFHRLALGYQGLLYLAAASVTSGLLDYVQRVLLGDVPLHAGFGVWFGFATVAVCYALSLQSAGTPDKWQHRLLRFGISIFVAAMAATLLTLALLLMSPSGTVAEIAMARSLALCLLALGLGWSSSRWRRPELMWLGYVTVAFWTLKLLFEDFRLGSAGPVAMSLLFYGTTWMMLPRLIRARKKTA